MSSLQFIVHPAPGTDDQLNDRYVSTIYLYSRARLGYRCLDIFGSVDIALPRHVLQAIVFIKSSRFGAFGGFFPSGVVIHKL